MFGVFLLNWQKKSKLLGWTSWPGFEGRYLHFVCEFMMVLPSRLSTQKKKFEGTYRHFEAHDNMRSKSVKCCNVRDYVL